MTEINTENISDEVLMEITSDLGENVDENENEVTVQNASENCDMHKLKHLKRRGLLMFLMNRLIK